MFWRDSITFSPALPEGKGFFLLSEGLTDNNPSSMETLSLGSNLDLPVLKGLGLSSLTVPSLRPFIMPALKPRREWALWA